MKTRLVVIWVLISLPVVAGSIDDIKKSCGERASLHAGKHWLEECTEELLTAPVHPVLRTIAPGTGFGLGIGAARVWRRGKVEYLPSVSLVGSPDKSFMAETDLTIALPPVSIVTRSTGSDDGLHEYGRRALALRIDSWDIDAKASISLHATHFEAKEQAFYGIGPFSLQSGLANYGERQTSAGVDLTDPLTSWVAVGVSADFLNPRITNAAADGRAAIGDRYREQSAPGVFQQSAFMRYEPHVRFRFTHLGHQIQFTDLRVAYQFYNDLDGPRYTFQRIDATSQTLCNLRLPSKGTASHRPAWKNYLCPEMRGANHCSIGTMSLTANVSAAFVGSRSAVPFYLQETLGGADISGTDTLRGFVDYRFRGPSRMFFQMEYGHPIWGPIGFLSFYDVGRVGQSTSDLAFEHMRHDLGVGLTVVATNRVVVRAYVGFGTGEGIRPNAKFGAGQ